MAADSDGCSLTAVVTCEGDLHDPDFTRRFDQVVGKLNGILGDAVKVHKLEPWNSVRVTLSIPREAALRLRKLASEGSAQLRALGILSVQVEGDQVISLRIASGSVNAEPQEIILQTTQDGSSSSRQEPDGPLSRFLSGANIQAGGGNTSQSGDKVQFKSPNVVCPPDSVVPKVPVSVASTSSTTPPNTKAYAGPFPFASMNQAIHSRENLNPPTGFTAPPPPYPGKHPPPAPVTMSSPLLVNLLQNDVTTPKTQKSIESSSVHSNTSAVKPLLNPPPNLSNRTGQNYVQHKPPSVSPTHSTISPGVRTIVTNRTAPNAFVQKTTSNLPSSISPHLLANCLEAEIPMTTKINIVQHTIKAGTSPIHVSQASTLSPSALSNTSIRQNNKMNSTTSSMAISNTTSNIIPNHIHYPPVANIQSPLMQPTMSANLTQNTAPKSVTPTPTKILPPPPPYSVAVNRQWDSIVQTSPFLDLTPSLTDLKVDDLEDLLPTLERDLARSPPEIPEELTEDKRTFLINPLTGELEPQSSGESDTEELSDVFTGLPSPAALSDNDTNSTIRPDTTDQSDSETRSSHSDSGKHLRVKSKVRDRGRDSPGLKPTEKIKLRLKLEKNEPISSAYKVDVSFIQQPKRASSSVIAPGEELRVPPLHISLRGRNHAFITNKKKNKLNLDGSSSKFKARKLQDASGKIKKSSSEISAITNNEESSSSILMNDPLAGKTPNSDPKKTKKFKSSHDHKEILTSSLMQQDSELKSKLLIHNSTHYKEKQKERRGSDSELARTSLKFTDSNGIISVEKKRRLSQSEPIGPLDAAPPVLGSTNVGTIVALPQKLRKEKTKIKDTFKSKELVRSKNFMKSTGDKYAMQVALPTGEIDMEAKFKQSLMEESENSIPRPPNRIENVHLVITDNKQMDIADKVRKAEPLEPPPLKDKSPEPDKCNTPDRKQDLGDKQSGRSPNSGAQGEDSGIESMDALSEKSPNQASQSPHAGDISEPVKSKTQVPDMLDIEAQLAKMEGLNGVEEDVNENQHDAPTKLAQCCELTSALQDSMKQGAVSLSVNVNPLPVKEHLQKTEVSLVPLKPKTKEEDLEPLPVRVTPPRYTYSNPDKGRGSESPTLSDEDSNNSCSNMNKSKSLLEQLLIEIPDSTAPSSPSPATRSVRTRALSKLNSPELNSPVSVKQTRVVVPPPATTKRKRHESENSNNSLEESRNKKPRKCSENAAELIKACMGVDPSKLNSVKKLKLQDESSDSDEPLIEKVRKTANPNSLPKKIRTGGAAAATGIKNVSVNTRRSVRATIPAPNTRSKGDKVHSDAEALRRKTRSAVSEGDSKRKKEVK